MRIVFGATALAVFCIEAAQSVKLTRTQNNSEDVTLAQAGVEADSEMIQAALMALNMLAKQMDKPPPGPDLPIEQDSADINLIDNERRMRSIPNKKKLQPMTPMQPMNPLAMGVLMQQKQM